jgi:hypothetical protein
VTRHEVAVDSGLCFPFTNMAMSERGKKRVLEKGSHDTCQFPRKSEIDKGVVTHVACATVDIFDHYEITVSRPVVEHSGGKEVMGVGDRR